MSYSISPPLIQLIETLPNPHRRHWISAITLPSKDRFIDEDEIALITLTLSPTTTNSEKPTSTANSNAFLHANVLMSSLLIHCIFIPLGWTKKMYMNCYLFSKKKTYMKKFNCLKPCLQFFISNFKLKNFS